MVSPLTESLWECSTWSVRERCSGGVSYPAEGNVRKISASHLHHSRQCSASIVAARSFYPMQLIFLASLLIGTRGQLTNPFPATMELSSLDGTNGFVINGEATRDRCGVSISSAGDVNGDGIDDLVIGAYAADPSGRSRAGKTYVVFGSQSFSNLSGNRGSFELSGLNGTNGFILNGEAANDESGYVVSSAGDVNGDGYADIVVGAYAADPAGRSDAGKSYVVFGSQSFTNIVGSKGALELSSLNGKNGVIFNGEDSGDWSGYAVSSAGDVNGDGIDDLVIGARYASPSSRSEAGKSYVVFGSLRFGSIANSAGSFELSNLDGNNGFILNGEAAYDWSGRSVSSAGDLNGDGITDLAIGAYLANPAGRSDAGKSYVVFGSRIFSRLLEDGRSLELSSLNGSNGLILNGEAKEDYSSKSLSSAGDVNGDGITDLVIGAYFADPSGKTNAGKSYVVFGNRSFNNLLGRDGSLELSSLKGNTGFILDGEAAYDRSGRSVSLAGDVNGDGIMDLLIGAPEASTFGKSSAGKSYVVFGSRSLSRLLGSNGSFKLSSLNGSNGFILNGESTNDQSGYAASSAGDVNGDGIADFVIGARFASPSGRSEAGKSYVIFGRDLAKPTLTFPLSVFATSSQPSSTTSYVTTPTKLSSRTMTAPKTASKTSLVLQSTSLSSIATTTTTQAMEFFNSTMTRPTPSKMWLSASTTTSYLTAGSSTGLITVEAFSPINPLAIYLGIAATIVALGCSLAGGFFFFRRREQCTNNIGETELRKLSTQDSAADNKSIPYTNQIYDRVIMEDHQNNTQYQVVADSLGNEKSIYDSPDSPL